MHVDVYAGGYATARDRVQVPVVRLHRLSAECFPVRLDRNAAPDRGSPGERTRHGRVAELQPVLLDRVLGGHSVERHQAGGRLQQALPVLHRVQRDPRDGVLCADLLWTARRGSPVLLRV
uniref:(northern house mosquito) hypothetical protein n=1 Tax=Culex pipiens TaxID=7175 RepID=A0A8D8P8L7_CULPI